MVSAFYTGVVALEVSGEDYSLARDRLTKATTIAPDEPAAWADLGLMYLREGKIDEAAQNLEKSIALGPENADVEVIYGLLENRRGNFDKAVERFKSAIKHDPKSLRAHYALAMATERLGGEGADAQMRAELDEILKLHPKNLGVLLEAARLAAKNGDAPRVRELLERVAAQSANFPEQAKSLLGAAQKAAAADNVRPVTTKVVYVKNSLLPWAQYRRDVSEVDNPGTSISPPIQHFIKLKTPSPDPAIPDEAMAMEKVSLPVGGKGWTCIKPAWFKNSESPVAYVANAKEVRRGDGQGAVVPFPGGNSAAPPTPDGVLPADWRNDFNTGLVLAGAGGVRLMRLEADGAKFSDATSTPISDAAVRGGEYAGGGGADLGLE